MWPRILRIYNRPFNPWLFCLLLVICVTGCSLSVRQAGRRASCSNLDNFRDSALQTKLETLVRELGLDRAAVQNRLSIELVDISAPQTPRAAGINSEHIMYAASLPKIAILFGLMKRVEEGSLPWDRHTQDLASQMIRYSSNSAATELFYLVSPEFIASLLNSPHYHLYCPKHGGGLWVGKEYGSASAWQREPLRQLSHAATASAVAQFYYLLETGNLLSPQETLVTKEILSRSALYHKFVKGLAEQFGIAPLYRKSGSWRDYHSDSVVVEHDGRKYIAVALAYDPEGSEWLERLIVGMDRILRAD